MPGVRIAIRHVTAAGIFTMRCSKKTDTREMFRVVGTRRVWSIRDNRADCNTAEVA